MHVRDSVVSARRPQVCELVFTEWRSAAEIGQASKRTDGPGVEPRRQHWKSLALTCVTKPASSRPLHTVTVARLVFSLSSLDQSGVRLFWTWEFHQAIGRMWLLHREHESCNLICKSRATGGPALSCSWKQRRSSAALPGARTLSPGSTL